MTDLLAAVAEVFASAAAADYIGEDISIAAHLLATAAAAVDCRAPDSLVVAALLHDVGHVVGPSAAGAPDSARDVLHEQVGARWLEQWFGPEVTEPVRLHVLAKRYLVATQPGYLLSAASIRTLALQGGPMSEAEQAHFRASPFWQQAVALRRFDDSGKDPVATVPGLVAYEPVLARAATSTCSGITRTSTADAGGSRPAFDVGRSTSTEH